ncbi:MAG: twin-arginine translocase TatA/TatE family subunit [Acidimicrobiales bacterium]
MHFASPAEIFGVDGIIVLVVLVVLGPDKLPKVARQVGSLWADLRRLREKLGSEVRDTFPDLTSTETVTHVVRSPLSFPESLTGDEANRDVPAPTTAEAAPPSGSAMAAGSEAVGVVHQVRIDQDRTADTFELN